MQIIYVLLVCLLINTTLSGQNKSAAQIYLARADSQYHAGSYRAAAKLYTLAIKESGRPGITAVYTACSWAMAGETDSAFVYLWIAAKKLNYSNLEHLEKDGDLISVHKDQRWKTLVKIVNKNHVLQHSQLETQIRYLPALRAAIKKGNARPKDYAYIQDRILMRQGHPQLFGTQLSRNPETGKDFIWPIQNVEDLDKRRLELGMEPMDQYIRVYFNLPGWNLNTCQEELPKIESYLRKTGGLK